MQEYYIIDMYTSKIKGNIMIIPDTYKLFDEIPVEF